MDLIDSIHASMCRESGVPLKPIRPGSRRHRMYIAVLRVIIRFGSSDIVAIHAAWEDAMERSAPLTTERADVYRSMADTYLAEMAESLSI